ncbi:hypothetical protein PAXRUDRAFT_168488, partial [Paxillus rubicundulus Ve08.2h10]
EEGRKKVEAEVRKQAEEEENRRRAEEERRRVQSQQAEKRKKAPGGTIIQPQEPEQPKVGPSLSRSTGLAGWVAGPQTPCVRCVERKKVCPGVRGDSRGRTCFYCRKSHMPCREPGVRSSLKGTSKQTPIDPTSPQGGKDHKRRRQKSPDYREEESDGEADRLDEEEDNLRVLVEVIVGFSTQYEEERRLTVEYREVLTFELTGIRTAMQTLAKVYVKGSAARQGGLDSGIGVDKPKREGSGSRTKTDPKGKAKEVDEDDDMEVAGEKEDDADEDKDVDVDGEVESLV